MAADLSVRTAHAVALLRESPQTLDGFLKLSEMFESTTLDPHSRETVILTVAARNQCHLCVDMHEAKLATLGPTPDPERLDAVRRFTLQILASSGAVSEEELAAFQAHGYTRRNALEVVLGIGAYTVSTFANRLTGAA
ncbi:carboxymuconolactone decarboxylase family protein [Streptomyces sp. NBC_01242]|uniref:carboxymuconolactone decarboxylase family protein n=1 Tax=Streptomyces sp. NBC_01242 TaxID=2903795 RepID=UPI00225952CB|nr:carboxymuconolactone decarboxylase family protein [Streptomyces sp. NBC_01242]MCX4799819.1 carboxymuconolactone decarboxylase family protein [Streptomyces sp. NBC_01242]